MGVGAAASYRHTMATAPTAARTHPRVAPLLALGLLATGCETYTVTREPDPPIGTAEWTAIWCAVALAGAVWVALSVVVIVGRRRPSVDRLLLGGSWVAGTTFLLGWSIWEIAREARLEAILGTGGCRALPLAERPRQLAQLTCTEGGLDDSALLLAVILLPAVLLGVACAVMALRGDARPWIPTLLAGAIGVGLLLELLDAGDGWTLGDEGLWLTLLVPALTATVAGTRALGLEPVAPRLPAVRGTDADVGAASFADRLQAVAIDALLVLLPLVLLGDNTSGVAEGVVCVGLVVAYLVGATAATGQTIGKRILRLRVVATGTDGPPDLPTALTRVVVLLGLPTLLLLSRAAAQGIFVLWIAVVAAPIAWPSRRGLHELLAGTKVVREG
jgi:uncharacterized RDD family membrane protein YckC